MESAELFQCFPALGTFVLELAPVKMWHTLDIATYLPADQCLMTLSAKMKNVSDADLVSSAYN